MGQKIGHVLNAVLIYMRFFCRKEILAAQAGILRKLA